tara:strand:- start:3112 stop:6669 length:3558 start_codon:yes stop_codon:yes gene_type:complete
MATKKTYINADEELIIQGKLTIEGNVTQTNTTTNVTQLGGSLFEVNSDGTDEVVTIALNSNNVYGNISFDRDNGYIEFSKPINLGANKVTADLVGDVYASNGTTKILENGTGSNATFTGVASKATILETAQNFSISGDASASAVSFNGSGAVVLATTLATVNSGVGSYGGATAVPSITVNAKGLVTAASSTTISIPSSQVNDFNSAVGARVDAELSGSTGITYSSGAISITNSGVTATSYGSATAIPTFTVNAQGQLTTAADVSIAITSSQVTDFNSAVGTRVDAELSGGTGITYTSGVISTTDADIVHDNLSGFVANEHIDHTTVSVTAGTGLTGGGTIAATRTLNVIGGDGITANANDIAVDSTVIRTTGNQNLAGTKTFTGTVDLTGATVNPFTVTGNLDVTGNLNYVAVTDLVVNEANITMNNGNADQDAHVFVGRTGNDTYLKYDHSSTRWQFSNDGSTDNNILLHSDFSGSTGITFSSGAISITNSGVTGGSYGTASAVPTFNVNAQGQLTTSTNTTIAIPSTAVTDFLEAVDDRVNNLLIPGSGITGTYNDGAGSYTVDVDSTVIRTTGDQSLAGTKTFTGKVILPSTNVTDAGAIFTDVDEAWVYVNGIKKQITPTASVGTVADVGSTGLNIYAGSTSAGNVITHGIKSIDGGTYTNATESGNVVTIDGDVSAIRGAFSGGGDIAYNNSTGSISFTQRTNAQVRSLVSGTGLIGYNASTGVISTTADNYASWTFDTDTGSPETVTSGDTVTFTAGTGIDVTHSGDTITISTDSSADISSVTAGTGLTGGGSSGGVTLNVAGGYGITANANDIEVANADIRGLFSGSGDISYNSSTGAFSFTDSDRSDATIRGLFSAMNDLAYNSSTGAFSYTMPDLAVSDFAGASIQLGSEAFVDSDTVLMTAAAVQDKITSYGYSTTTGDITGVTAGVGLSGGGTSGTVTVTLDMSELTDMTAAMTGTDEFIVLDSGADRRKAASEIGLSIFNNDSGFTTNVGDITGVSAGTYLTGGGSSGAVTLNVDATTTNTAGKVVARDGSGNFSAGTITATATQAQYADLAENYVADADYEPGTVVVFGGNEEITVTDDANSPRVAGVISTDPAHLMNSTCEGVFVNAVALRGRVPVKCLGVVKKGDILITSHIAGVAMVASDPHFVGAACIIGKAISTKLHDAEGVVEVLV